jgi:hypothetical protein
MRKGPRHFAEGLFHEESYDYLCPTIMPTIDAWIPRIAKRAGGSSDLMHGGFFRYDEHIALSITAVRGSRQASLEKLLEHDENTFRYAKQFVDTRSVAHEIKPNSRKCLSNANLRLTPC